MLPSITKKYRDYSTDKYFAFSFICEDCGGEWESEHYPFSMADVLPIEELEVKTHNIIWVAEHSAAYERANNEAAFYFSQCPKCGRRVCDNCFSVFDDVCARCKNENDSA